MEKLFSEPLFYIFFVYGASFLIMANLVVNGTTRGTSITLVSTFYMLAAFGLTHGITELTDWARVVLKTLGGEDVEVLLYVSQIFLIISFIFLLQFAVNLMTYKSEKKGLVRALPLVFLAGFLAVMFVMGVTDIRKIGLMARYGFGFSGSLLSAVMLFKLGNTMKVVGSKKLTLGLNASAVAFGAYAVFGGLIIDPVLGLPIQLFRAACAVTIAVASSAILEVFKHE
jgi:hypothetical protein